MGGWVGGRWVDGSGIHSSTHPPLHATKHSLNDSSNPISSKFRPIKTSSFFARFIGSPGAVLATFKQHVNALKDEAAVFASDVENAFHAEDIGAAIAQQRP